MYKRVKSFTFQPPFTLGKTVGSTYFKYVRALWTSHYQGHSTTDFQQMSASTRSCTPLHVVIQNCKISTDAAVRSAGFRAIN
jgi:hypothetical protein